MPKIRRTATSFVPNSIAREGFVHRHSYYREHVVVDVFGG